MPCVLDDSTYRKLFGNPEHVIQWFWTVIYHYSPLIETPARWPIFLDAMQPLDLELTPRNGISRLTLPQLQQVGYYSFCYFVSFCWTLVLLDTCSVERFSCYFCFSDELIGCRSNMIIIFIYSSHLHDFLCLATYLKRAFILFIW
jgi:hypothetical protein